MPTSDKGQNPHTSFEQLMAQRYPQSRPGAGFPNQTIQSQAAKMNPQQLQQLQQLQRLQQLQAGGPLSMGSPGSGSGSQPRPKVLSSAGASTLQGVSSPSLSAAKTSGKSASSSAKKDTSKPGHSSGLAYNTAQQRQHLSHCDWKDKTLWASRLILGGNSINGFLRATATAQRIKKQRARQNTITKKTAAAAVVAAGGPAPEPEEKKEPKIGFDPVEEEKLKKDIMNPRTAKKIKSELEAGLKFCATIHNLLRGVLFDIDPAQSPYLPTALFLEEDQLPSTTPIPPPSALKQGSILSQQPAQSSKAPNTNDSTIPWAVKSNAAGGPNKPQQRPVISQQPDKSTASAGNAGGSTLRKFRKKKLPPTVEPPVNLPEFDNSGKRLCAKREHNFRLFEVLRFRPLRSGDFVAARLSSRELWILARVLKDYAGFGIPALDFLQLSGSRRDSVFREKILVKDVEDKESGGPSQVARSLVLPLPRTYSEAAEWGQRIKKGSRVYAMYPQTTSLYAATVMDSTTYCRGDDDIFVVEFDGEEHDATGKLPQYHIPARFITPIPREFPSSQPNTPQFNAVASTGRGKRKGASMTAGTQPQKKQANPDDMFLMDFSGGGGGGDFDALDLDFDKPLEAHEDETDFQF